VATAAAAGGQVDPTVESALVAARAKAATGDPIAQFSLGSVLYYGTRRTSEAVEWFRRAAEQGLPSAEFQMGQLHDFGFGLPQDDARALEWYRRAAEHGSAPAQRTVGEFYKNGRAGVADPAEAARWYRRAADANDLRAQYELGQLYFAGTGVPHDYASAYVWFSLAASQTPLVDNRKQLVELRNICAARMTPEQLEDAVRQVAEWKPSAGAR
jgi:TPR repeat protein